MEKKYLEKKNVMSFCISFFMGLVVHLMVLSNRIFTADDYTRAVLGWDEQISVGRILFPLFQITSSSKYNINAVSGVVALLFLAAVIEQIFSIFDIKNLSTKMVISAVIMTSPCTFSTLVFPSCSTSYFLSFFLAFFSLRLIVFGSSEDISLRKILSVLLIVISMLIYQVYGTVIIVAFFVKLLSDYLTAGKKIITKANIINLGLMVISIVIYYVVYKLVFFLLGIESTAYQGFNKVGPRKNVASFLDALKKIIQSFWDFWTGQKLCFYSALNGVFWFFLLVVFVLIIKNSEQKLKHFIWSVVLLGMMVGSSFMLYLISSKVYYHNIMTWGCCFFYILVVVLVERMHFESLKYLIIGIISVICLYNYQNGNVAYMKLDIAREKTDYMIQKMMNDIDRVSDGTEKIAIIGDMTKHDTEDNLEIVPDINAADEEIKIISPARFENYTRYYYGRSFDLVGDEDLEILSREILADKNKYKDVYPYGTYCFKYGNYIVLNFGE